MDSIYSQLDQHQLLFTQVAIQLVAWYHVFEYTKWYLRTYCTTHKWFIQWSQKPSSFGGEVVGAERVIGQMGHCVQAFVGGIAISLGYYLNSPQLFIMGALSEFSYEFIETYEIIKERYIIKEGLWSADKTPFFGVANMLFHHSGAFTVILPACMYYSDNEHVQKAAMGLLGWSALFCPLNVFYNSRDVYDLKERGQFTVCFVAMLVFFVYFRWFVCVQGMYGFLREEFPSFPWQLKLLFSVYVLCIKLLDLFVVMLLSLGVHKWLFTSAATKRPTKITKASLRRPTLIPIELIRTQSTPLMC